MRGANDSAEPARWRIEEHESIDSTQRRAGELPAWSAVVAREQTAGRGQRERTFVSDRGGLYLSAVLPYAGEAGRARGFALAVGWALCVALRAAGFAEVRLRWPNDLMIGSRKIGGILVEQVGRETLAVGIGLNVRNAPWREDATLAATAGTLGAAISSGGSGSERQPASVPAVPHGKGEDELRTLARIVLGAVARAREEFARAGFAGIVARLEACWNGERLVELELVSEVVGASARRGWFAGVTEDGAVRLREDDGTVGAVPDHWIRRLREVG